MVQMDRLTNTSPIPLIINREGLILHGLYGTVPEPFMSSLTTELYGIYYALRHALPPIRIFTDNISAADSKRIEELTAALRVTETGDLLTLSMACNRCQRLRLPALHWPR